MSSSCTLQNSDILANVMKKLSHLSQSQQVSCVIFEFVDLFPGTPGRTVVVCHEVYVMGALQSSSIHTKSTQSNISS